METLSIVICPMKEELDELLNQIKDKKEGKIGNIKGYFFSSGKEDYFAFLGRIGKENIGFDIGYLSGLVNIKKIFNIGVAGSLKDEIVPLNVVVATKVCYYDVDVTSGGNYKLGQMAGENDLYFHTDTKVLETIDDMNTTLTIAKGTIISGDSFATKENMNKDLLKHFDDPLAVDMESGAVGQAAKRLGVPFTIIRGISDNVFSNDNADSFNEFTSMSARRAATVFLHYANKEFVD